MVLRSKMLTSAALCACASLLAFGTPATGFGGVGPTQSVAVTQPPGNTQATPAPSTWVFALPTPKPDTASLRDKLPKCPQDINLNQLYQCVNDLDGYNGVVLEAYRTSITEYSNSLALLRLSVERRHNTKELSDNDFEDDRGSVGLELAKTTFKGAYYDAYFVYVGQYKTAARLVDYRIKRCGGSLDHC